MPSPYETRILRVLAYIHDNPTADLSLDRLADVAAMSRFHWHRVFRAMTGETCATAVRRMRLHLAATWLVQTDKPLAGVAAECGYANPGSFARAFAGQYGHSPDAFRKAGRLLTPLGTIRETGASAFPITIRTDPPRRLAGLMHKGPYHLIGQSFAKLGALCDARGLWPRTGPMIALHTNAPTDTPSADLRSFAAVEWHGASIPQDLQEQGLRGGKTAVLSFTGDYSGLVAGYQALYGTWLPASGEEPADAPGYEVFLNGPRDTAPADLRTEICLPLTQGVTHG